MNSTAQQALDPQLPLPTGPTHVAARGRPTRTPAQADSDREFLAAAGRVEFGRHEATLQAVWMSICYFGSLSDKRECYAGVERVSKKPKVSGRTVRRCLVVYIARGIIETDDRKGGRNPTCWRVLLPEDVRAGRTPCPGRADTVSAKGKEGIEKIYVPREVPGVPVQEESAAQPDPEPQNKTLSSVPSSNSGQVMDFHGSRQCRLYAKLYRKVKGPGWPDLTDDLLAKFEALPHGAKKATLDPLLHREREIAARGEIALAPSGMTPLGEIGGCTVGQPQTRDVITTLRKATKRGVSTSYARAARKTHQADCDHEWDTWGGCLVCGEQRREADEAETEG